LINPTSGEIWFEGQRIDTLAPEQIVRMGISHVPEGRRIFPGLTVKENIMLGSTARGHLTKQAMAEGVEEMFGIFPDIKRFADALGWTLSGGQQQMLAVARGLWPARLLLLDEPSLGLAPVSFNSSSPPSARFTPAAPPSCWWSKTPHGALSPLGACSRPRMTVEGTTSQLRTTRKCGRLSGRARGLNGRHLARGRT
jgi:branched-chain amino acid transport system ATP-binding protein